MQNETTMAERWFGIRPTWRGDVAKAIAAALFVLAVGAAGGFANLTGTADNDSTLRLVQVRDLIGGQSWFDLHQYRMGTGGGLLMHWSRLVDAPIAAILLVVSAITGSQALGETAALIIWPLALYATALYLLLRIGRLTAGEEAQFPLLVIGGTTLYYTGIFALGAIDHHNVQLVLMLAMLLFLLRADKDAVAGWLAGTAAVLMLAVGMETAPYVAVGGLFVAGWFLVGGAAARCAAAGFGAAFASTSAAVFLATVPASQWGAGHCDAYSVAQFAIGAVAGVGLAIVATLPAANATIGRRGLALLLLGAVVTALAGIYFPQCLNDPYADLGPILQSYWLDVVGEAQPLTGILAKEPEAAAGHYATVLIALFVMAMRMRKTGLRREDALIVTMLAAALLVSIWQVRGSRFSLPLACVPLAYWISGWRVQAQASPGAVNSFRLAGAWLVSFNATWILAALGLWFAFSPAAEDEAAGSAKQKCYASVDYAELSALPAESVLTISNLGAPVLAYTGHRVLAGPYHRNLAGNLATLEAFMGSSDKAQEIARKNGVGLVAFCAGNGETTFLANRAPNGLMSDLLAGDIPAWMELIPESKGRPLELYRVLPE